MRNEELKRNMFAYMKNVLLAMLFCAHERDTAFLFILFQGSKMRVCFVLYCAQCAIKNGLQHLFVEKMEEGGKRGKGE